MTGDPLVIVVPANSPHKTVQELAAAVKTAIRQCHLGRRLGGRRRPHSRGAFAKAAGADLTKFNYVPFSGGGEALAAMLSGTVAARISGYGEFERQIKTGKLRALRFLESAPEGVDVPTLKEQGIDVSRELARDHGRPRYHAGPA